MCFSIFFIIFFCSPHDLLQGIPYCIDGRSFYSGNISERFAICLHEQPPALCRGERPEEPVQPFVLLLSDDDVFRRLQIREFHSLVGHRFNVVRRVIPFPPVRVRHLTVVPEDVPYCLRYGRHQWCSPILQPVLDMHISFLSARRRMRTGMHTWKKSLIT